MSDVRPLKKSSGSGLPRQVQANADRLVAKGLVFEGDTNFTSEKVGGYILDLIPDCSVKPTYKADKEINFVEYFEGATQTVPNRRARVDITYTGIDPTSEVCVIYDPADGTTVIKTFTWTHTWTSGELTKSTLVTT